MALCSGLGLTQSPGGLSTTKVVKAECSLCLTVSFGFDLLSSVLGVSGFQTQIGIQATNLQVAYSET